MRWPWPSSSTLGPHRKAEVASSTPIATSAAPLSRTPAVDPGLRTRPLTFAPRAANAGITRPANLPSAPTARMVPLMRTPFDAPRDCRTDSAMGKPSIGPSLAYCCPLLEQCGRTRRDSVLSSGQLFTCGALCSLPLRRCRRRFSGRRGARSLAATLAEAASHHERRASAPSRNSPVMSRASRAAWEIDTLEGKTCVIPRHTCSVARAPAASQRC